MNDSAPRSFKYVFGPVPSRRLGRSLGVDLVPHKVCSFNCVYCQLGRTTSRSVERAVYSPVREVIAEVAAKLATVARPDYITLAGSGEPTLHAGLGEIVRGIKNVTDIPVDVLTNGSLFFDPAVRSDCASADLVLPTLVAGDEDTFRLINRPDPGLTLERIVTGLEKFRDEYSGQIWLEVFLIGGVNATPDQVKRMLPLIERIRPDKIQLNTAVRPTAEPGVVALGEKEMAALCALFGPRAEVIADFRRPPVEPQHETRAEEVLAMIRRHPITVAEIAVTLGLSQHEAEEHVRDLLARKAVTEELRDGRSYLRAL